MFNQKFDKEKLAEFKENVMEKYNLDEMSAIDYIKKFGPEQLFKLGLFENKFSWREGYTKPTIDDKRKKNRKKNKEARKARKRNR